MFESDREELRRKVRQAETSCRQERELHERMFRHGLALEGLIKETEAENKCLTSKVKDLQQQMENRRKKTEDEVEEALRQEEERIVKRQCIQIRKMEKVNQKLREENEDLTAQLDQRFLGEKYQEEIQNLRRAEQALKHTLEDVEEVLRLKDEEIEMKFGTLIKKNREIEEYFKTIKDLRQNQQELRDQLSSRLEEQTLAALNSVTTTETRRTLVSAAADEEDEDKHERLLKMENLWHCAQGLWKGATVAGAVALRVLLPVGIMASMVPMCYDPHPDHSLWNIIFNLLEPYCELHHTHPPVY